MKCKQIWYGKRNKIVQVPQDTLNISCECSVLTWGMPSLAGLKSFLNYLNWQLVFGHSPPTREANRKLAACHQEGKVIWEAKEKKLTRRINKSTIYEIQMTGIIFSILSRLCVCCREDYQNTHSSAENCVNTFSEEAR